MLVKPSQAAPLIFLVGRILAACEPTNLYVAHHTVVGVNASMNSERTTGHLVIGYDRKFATVVPKSVDAKSGTDGGKDAMAALSCSDVEVKGIFLNKFVEYLATGEAATTFATQFGETGEAGKIFDCYDDSPSK